ncbi:MAG: hypothetical protein HYS98_02845 [Deltaproteobacteria bacterium]|nr:hypothetical protein [Deltaproteobacteria bacterium]
MKASKKNGELIMGKHENPVDFFRRVRRQLMAKYDNDVSKYMDSIREEEKKHKNRLIDLKTLPKRINIES